jgi:hypothetical protein
MEKQGKSAQLVIAASPGTEVQQYVWKFRARIDQKFPGKSNPTAEKLYLDAKAEAKVSAKTLAVVFAAANPTAPAKSKLQANTAKLIATIVALWKELGTPIMLPGESDVNYHGSLPTKKNQQRHHMPQDAVMKRLALWIRTYFQRAAKDPKEVSRRESVLSARGVKYSKAKDYKKDDGVSMLMASVRHSQTRSFASLPQPLNIPYYTGPSSVKGKQAADKQVGKYVSQVSDEFSADREDVVAIYEGRKGLPPVGKKSQAKIPGAVSKVKSLNTSRFGSFLK